MNMVTWTEVIDTTTGRIYADCADVERKTGVPVILVSACIQTGKSINGHHFKRVTRRASGGSYGHIKHVNSKQQEEREQAGLVRLPLTDELKADCIRQYEAGVPLRQIAHSTGRVSLCKCDLARWNGGVPPKRPEGYVAAKRGSGICINDKRPVWESSENQPSASVDDLEGAESGDSSPT